MIEYSKVYFMREGKGGVVMRKGGGGLNIQTPPLDTLLVGVDILCDFPILHFVLLAINIYL